MTKTVSEILNAAADLIEPEGAWTQGWFAKDARGVDTISGGADAVYWCAFGAMERASNFKWDQLAEAAVALMDAIGSEISEWNDAPERTQAEVVAKLREAAALAEESRS